MPYKEKADQAAAAKKHYEANKEAYCARARAWNKRQSEILRQIVSELKQTGCMDCGGHFHPHAMEFDHVRGTKYRDIATLAGQGRCSVEKFHEELTKCDLVCANCHRVRTHERRQSEVLH